MCKLQEPPFKMSEPAMNIVVSQSIDDILALAPKPKKKERPVKLHGEKKSKKQKKRTKVPLEEKLILPEPIPGPSAVIDNAVYLPTYEEMMFQEPLQHPLFKPVDLEQVTSQEYLWDESKPLHTHFILPHQGKRSTCPVYFSSLENKLKVLDALCNEMHSKLFNQWGNLACDCGPVPILKLNQSPKNLNKVFLCCPKTRETVCRYFQWIHQPPKPNYVPKTATPTALKKRLNDMVLERLQKRPKVEYEETIVGFVFP